MKCLKPSQKYIWPIYLIQPFYIISPASFVETFRWPAFSGHQPEIHEPPQFSPKYLKLTQMPFLRYLLGNLFAETNFEKYFTLLTLLSSVLIWLIQRTGAAPNPNSD